MDLGAEEIESFLLSASKEKAGKRGRRKGWRKERERKGRKERKKTRERGRGEEEGKNKKETKTLFFTHSDHMDL